MTISGAAHVDIMRRSGVGQFLEDRSDTSCVYYGVTPDQLTLTSENQWQIWRVENVSGVLHTTFANRAKYNQIWDDRAGLFPACVGTDPIWPEVPVTGTFTPSGLNVAGLLTEVAIDAVAWTALPATPLANRNAISIQNQSGVEIKMQYAPATVGYVGVKIAVDGERFYDITDNIIVYAKAASGTPTILVEEIS